MQQHPIRLLHHANSERREETSQFYEKIKKTSVFSSGALIFLRCLHVTYLHRSVVEGYMVSPRDQRRSQYANRYEAQWIHVALA